MSSSRSLKAARDFRPATLASRAKWSFVWRVFQRVEELEAWAVGVRGVRVGRGRVCGVQRGRSEDAMGSLTGCETRRRCAWRRHFMVCRRRQEILVC